MELPKVKNVNKGKRHKKKHYFKVGDPIVFKWWGERDYGFVSELTTNREGYATYKVRATGRIGCIYSDLELDDPDDPYCYVSSILTNSISDRELGKIKEHKEGKHIEVKVSEPKKYSKSKSNTNTNKPSKKVVRKRTKKTVNKSELKKAVQKQKDFLNGKVDKSFW